MRPTGFAERQVIDLSSSKVDHVRDVGAVPPPGEAAAVVCEFVVKAVEHETEGQPQSCDRHGGGQSDE